MLRRLHAQQPPAFAFTPANAAWAEAQIGKYPEGRQASAIIPLLWRAQEQEGWLSKPAIEAVAGMLGLAYIRALEVATFYFMFQLSPVGSVAHVQICGTLSCMIMGSDDLMTLCQSRISREQHHPSADGRVSWEEVECLGACANAPMAQIGKDYYEDLNVDRLGSLLDEMAAGRVPRPGPQGGRFASEPEGGATTLTAYVEGRNATNASVDLALSVGDTLKRIDGTEVPLVAPWMRTAQPEEPEEVAVEDATMPTPGEGVPVGESGISVMQAPADSAAKPPGMSSPDGGDPAMAGGSPSFGVTHPGGPEAVAGPTAEPDVSVDGPLLPEQVPSTLTAPRGEQPADDLQAIEGIGPDLAALLNSLGFWHYDQIADWSPGEVAWVNSRLGTFRGGIERDGWIAQARRLSGR